MYRKENLRTREIIIKPDDIALDGSIKRYMAYSPYHGEFACYGIGSTESKALTSFLVEERVFLNALRSQTLINDDIC